MKKFIYIVSVLLSVLVCSDIFAQSIPGTLTQQSPVRLDACGKIINHATGVGNTAVTATLTPNSSEAIYICAIEVSQTANAAVVGAAGTSTTITITGCQTTFTFFGNNTTLIIGDTRDISHTYPVPMKCKLDTAVTAAWANTGQATQNVRVTLIGYSAP